MAAKFTVSGDGTALAKHIRALEKPIAAAATKTINDAAREIKKQSRTAIAGAGFSKRASDNLQYKIEPAQAETIDVSARFFFRAGFFNVFEEGATIRGKPLLWLPLPTVPLGLGRKRLTPREFIARGGSLFRTRGTRKPFLVGKAGGSVRVRRRRRPGDRSENVPLFVGVPQVRIPKKFDIKSIIKRVADRIPELYARNARET